MRFMRCGSIVFNIVSLFLILYCGYWKRRGFIIFFFIRMVNINWF